MRLFDLVPDALLKQNIETKNFVFSSASLGILIFAETVDCLAHAILKELELDYANFDSRVVDDFVNHLR